MLKPIGLGTLECVIPPLYDTFNPIYPATIFATFCQSIQWSVVSCEITWYSHRSHLHSSDKRRSCLGWDRANHLLPMALLMFSEESEWGVAGTALPSTLAR
eukprot:scaffold505514_cov27-Prasinocladus_malaysianus.AAC.1